MEHYKKGNLNLEKLSKKDKSHLRKRIYNSIYSFKRRKRILKFTIAASVVFLIGFVTVSLVKTKVDHSAIEKFAETQNESIHTKNIQLVLSDKKSIAISETDAKISYSKSGKKVNVGHSSYVEQDAISSGEPVFNTLIVPFGKRSEITLSDGSKVWLNSGSKLIFPARFASDKREVYLEGEAIFEVSHNKYSPFFVKARNHEIKVLGTIFNLSNYSDDDAVYTVLKRGSVQINYTSNTLFNSEKKITMKPGTMVTYEKAKYAVYETNVNTEQYFSWRDGIFIFKNDSLKSIMKKVARYYNVEIIIVDSARANETFSGYLDVKDSIESVLATIKETEPSGFEYTFLTDHKIIIN
ncbi:MAG: FecR domain-containing protein [Flavobacteriaceae bacterium]|nr:FecR domain-containing protein [Flavobacteriaceae bacterium]